jgi:hypothetical protein
LAAIVVGALAGGILARSAHAWLPVAVLLPLGVVVAGSLAGSRSWERAAGRR